MEIQGENCITNWLPKIEGHVPTPITKIVSLDLTEEQDKQFWGIFDGDGVPEWFHGWAEKLKEAALSISSSGPWFLRTGVFSGKHDFDRHCNVTDINKLGSHVLNLFEFSQIVDLFGLPYKVWAVREWLHGPSILKYERFGGMPLRREFRAFANNGEVLCIHPYWPAEALDEEIVAMPEIQAMNELGADAEAVTKLAAEASKHVDGEWSIDCLWTDRGWYVTDMAKAETSYHWPECPRK